MFMGQEIHQAADNRDQIHSVPASVRPSPTADCGLSLARSARRMIAERRKFEQLFGADLFADPARDILLDLFAAGEEGKRISVSSCCVAAAVPATTALRHINALRQASLVVQSPDPNDGRRIYLTLTPHARTMVETHLRAHGTPDV